jgi:dTDP-4-dehydrorhamnose reductase
VRILVTGVTGQVGGALVARLTARHAVIAADRARLDLSEPAAIAGRLDALTPDLIVNPAAYTVVDRAEDQQGLAFRINAEATGAIARWAAGRGVPLVHFSTDYVFDGSGERPWREKDRTGPLSAYGASKLAGEDAVRAAGGTHLVVRTSWVYAAKGANFLRTITRLAGERKELRIVADQFGAPTSAGVIADAVVGIVAGGPSSLARRLAAADGLVNVAATGVTSWHGFAVAIVDGLKVRGLPITVDDVVPIRTQDYPTKAKRPANSRLDLTRLKRTFGIETARWEAALEVELDRLAAGFHKD